MVTIYFTAGGLTSSAWVNVLQLSVKLVGFGLAVPLALGQGGGWNAVVARISAPDAYWSVWRNGNAGCGP